MQMSEKTIKFLTVLAVVVVFVLALVMITLISQKIQLNAKEKQLEEQLNQLQQLKEELGEEVDGEYRMTQEKIEEYLRENMGMIDANDTIWKPAE